MGETDIVAKLIGNPWHPAFLRHNMFFSSAVGTHVCYNLNQGSLGKMMFFFVTKPQVRTLAPRAGPHFRIGCGVCGSGRAKVHSDGHEIWALGGWRPGFLQFTNGQLVNSWSTCQMIKTLKTFNFRPFPNLGILQFSIFPKYPKFFANALEAKSQGPTKRQRREPLPAVRRLVSPTEWPWSMNLADLGYGRTGKSMQESCCGNMGRWNNWTPFSDTCSKNHRTGGRKIPPGFRQFNEKRQAMLNANFADPKEDDEGCGGWDHGAMLQILGPNCGSSLELNCVTALWSWTNMQEMKDRSAAGAKRSSWPLQLIWPEMTWSHICRIDCIVYIQQLSCNYVIIDLALISEPSSFSRPGRLGVWDAKILAHGRRCSDATPGRMVEGCGLGLLFPTRHGSNIGRLLQKHSPMTGFMSGHEIKTFKNLTYKIIKTRNRS